MDLLFRKEKLIESTISPFENFCVGYPGQGSYLTALVMGTGVVQKTLGHEGSEILDRIVAFDKAEISDTYLGQINMITVSSFCGPQGLIWGHDLAKEERELASLYIDKNVRRKFPEIIIRSGANLRKAGKALFGVLEKRRYPILPGSHVPCAGKYSTKAGPAFLYGALAIGIPEDRASSACLLMEDVGEIKGEENTTRRHIITSVIQSILDVGKNQKIFYKEIYVDIVTQRVSENEIGCVLVAMPYFLLAKNAFNVHLATQTLQEWESNQH